MSPSDCSGTSRTPVPPRGGFTPFARNEIEQSIPDRFRSQVNKHGDRLAVKFGPKAHSYRALDLHSNRIAHAIGALRGDIEEPVLILLRQAESLVSGILGALKAGKIYVPQNSSSSIDAIRKVLHDCDASMIITDSLNRDLAMQLAGRSRTVLDIDQLPKDISEEDRALTLSPERAAYIYYTSGSTGTPKGVVDCHRNVLHNIMRYTNSLAIGTEDRISLLQMPCFSGAVSSMFGALLNGASLYPFDLSKSGIRNMADWVLAEKLTMFHAVPVIFEQLTALGKRFPELRVIRLEGDRALPKHLHIFKRDFNSHCWLVNGLGATETGLVRQFFFNPAMSFDEDAVPIGYPVEDMEVLLLGADNKPVAPGDIGEIAVKSHYLATGYWRRGMLTERYSSQLLQENKFTTYLTGDMGQLKGKNCLYYMGRKDFDMKIGGQRIDPSIIEATLLSLKTIRDVVVSTYEERYGRRRLVAYIVLTDDTTLSVDTLRLELAKTLPAIAIPSKYVFLDSLPLDNNFKVNRRGLPAPGNQRPKLDTAFIRPETKLERKLANAFRQILGLEKVGINDDFFALGGDSLATNELALLLEETFSTTIPSELFFDTLSVAKIIAWWQASKDPQSVVALRADGKRTPLFLFHDFAGHTLDYIHLANALNDARPVYGLQRSAGKDTTIAPLLVPELAANYVKEVRRIQPEGPYILGGQCFGGLLAFETAQQLRKSGVDVQCVILMDTAFPGLWTRRLIQRISPRRQWHKLMGIPMSQRTSYIFRRVKNILRSAFTTIERRVHWLLQKISRRRRNWHVRLNRPTDAHRFAESKYRASSYHGEVVLITVGSPTNQSGWKSVVESGPRIIELPVERHSDSYSHPTASAHIFGLIKAVDQLLAEISDLPPPQNDP